MEYKELTQNEISFLSTYRPVSNFMTTKEEMDEVINALNIKSLDNMLELRALRNSVVKFYSKKMDELENRSGVYDVMIPLQSVTAVIDDIMIRHFNYV